MKRNRKLKYSLCAWLALAAGVLTTTACNDNVESVDFNVRVEGTAVAGSPVTFVFDGNPDYISFFSGEAGSNYANKDRTHVDVQSLTMSYEMTQRYTTRQDFKEPVMHVMVSHDFTGSLTPEAIAAATWTDLSAQAGATTAERPFPVPNPDAVEQNPTGYATAEGLDFSAYGLEPFYLAFKYLAPEHPTTTGGTGANATYANHPRVDIANLCLSKVTVEGETVLSDDMANDWGFSTVFVNSTTQTNYTVESTNLMFQPQNDHRDRPVEVWMVSQRMDVTSVEPDRGEPIKGTNTRVTSYEYTYNEPGTYTATFIATNANMWNSKQTVRQVTFEVADPNAAPEDGSEADGSGN